MLNSPNLQHYLNDGPTKGIIRIYNLDTDQSLLIKSDNIIEDSKNIRFKLDLGLFENQNLQKEYSEIGLELFAIEPMLISDDDSPLNDLLKKANQILLDNNIKTY